MGIVAASPDLIAGQTTATARGSQVLAPLDRRTERVRIVSALSLLISGSVAPDADGRRDAHLPNANVHAGP
jgi:hypothetical protein